MINGAIAVEVEKDKSYYWCSCGKSSKQPFCDGSHKGTEFTPLAYKADETKRMFFCACKKTNNQPFCDGSHSYLLCDPSQNGGLLVFLQAQKNIFFVSSAL